MNFRTTEDESIEEGGIIPPPESEKDFEGEPAVEGEKDLESGKEEGEHTT